MHPSLCRAPSKTMKGDPFRPVSSFAVDMFPHTDGVEVVVLFERGKTLEATLQAQKEQDNKTIEDDDENKKGMREISQPSDTQQSDQKQRENIERAEKKPAIAGASIAQEGNEQERAEEATQQEKVNDSKNKREREEEGSGEFNEGEGKRQKEGE